MRVKNFFPFIFRLRLFIISGSILSSNLRANKLPADCKNTISSLMKVLGLNFIVQSGTQIIALLSLFIIFPSKEEFMRRV